MVFTRKGGYGLRLGGARRDPVEQTSVLAHRFKDENQKKQGLQPKLRRDFVRRMSVSALRFSGEDQKRVFVAKSKSLS